MKFNITEESVTVVLDGEACIIPADSCTYSDLVAALLAKAWDEVPKLLGVKDAILNWSKGSFLVKGETVYFKNDPLPTALNDRIIKMLQAGDDPKILAKFWKRLKKNPSKRSTEQLFSFLVHEGIPFTSDGKFLAYKSVTKDYLDHHTKTVSNKVGSVNEMPRNEISDDPMHACHAGFHVGALEYAKTFCNYSSEIIICEVDPKDVVCIPYDCSQQKMRVCKYKVVGHYGDVLPSTTFDIENVELQPDYDEGLDEDYSEDYDEDYSEDYDEDYDEEAWTVSEAIKAAEGGDYVLFDALDADDLSHVTLSMLRSYASKHLKIYNAHKIPGGKSALIARIDQVR